jgi:hypothetical protein
MDGFFAAIKKEHQTTLNITGSARSGIDWSTDDRVSILNISKIRLFS